MKKYELIGEGMTLQVQMTEADGTIRFVPICESNSDYQRYLRWLENPNADDTQGGIN